MKGGGCIKRIVLTKREDELMNFLWDAGKPLLVEEMLNTGGEHAWNETYLRAMLKSLEKKGAVECCGFLLRSKLYARQFKPKISKEEFYMQLALDRGAKAETLFQVAAAAAMKSGNENPDEVKQRLEKILEKEIQENVRTGTDGEK